MSEHYLPAKAREMQQLQVKLFLAVGDVLALLSAFFLGRMAYWWAKDLTLREAFIGWWGQFGAARVVLFLCLTMAAVLLFGALGHYSRRRPFWDELLQIFTVLIALAVVDGALVFLGQWYLFSRLWFATVWLAALLLLPTVRIQIRRALMRSGHWQRQTVILGVGENALEAAAALKSEPSMGFQVMAFLSPPWQSVPDQPHIRFENRCVPVIALGDDPKVKLEQMGRPHLVVALEADMLLEQQKLLQRLSFWYADMSVIPPIRGLPLFGMEMTHFFSHEVLMLHVRNNLARLAPRFLKRTFDIVGSVVLLLALSPLMAYLILRTGWVGGGVFYGHTRIGKHGQPFSCYKFRTMVPNAEQVLKDILATDPAAREEWDRDFKLKNDPRVTPLGAFLRRTSLDELPQLWNVLKGEMSLVGPRPIVEAELERYSDKADYYLGVRPGITGLWQISGRNDVSYSDRVDLDAWYVRNWSLWYDLVILMKTAKAVLARQGAY